MTKYLFQYPEAVGPEVDMMEAGPIAEVARMVERSGWDGIAFTEHPAPSSKWLNAGGHQTLDPFVALAAAGAVTERITLLTYLAVMPYRNPFMLAKSATSVDRISNGRFVLGVGTGYLKSEFFALGVDFDERNDLFDEALEVMPLHWSGEPFDYQGRHFNARDVIGRPTPVNKSIPIWIGGNAKITLRRVAEKAHGWMPMVGPPSLATTSRTATISTVEDVERAIGVLRDLAGDRFAELDIIVLYTDETILDTGKDVERHRDAMGRLAEIGSTWISFAFDLRTAEATKDFVEGVGATYLQGR